MAEREIGPGRYLSIIGTAQSNIPSYVIGLQYAVGGQVRYVKLLPPSSPRILSARDAIECYRSIRSVEEFEEECERAKKVH